MVEMKFKNVLLDSLTTEYTMEENIQLEDKAHYFFFGTPKEPDFLADVTLTSNGFQFHQEGQIDLLSGPREDGPTVVLPTETQKTLHAYWLKEYFDGSKDDVLSQSFAQGVLLTSNGTEIEIAPEAKALLNSWGNHWIDTLQGGVAIPPGPYYFKNNALWKALRLYDDHQGAFVLATTKATDEDGKYGVLNSHALAVPSRLSVRATAEKPFAEWRVAIKDNIDIRGLRTSMCNKAFLELYPPVAATASSVKSIIEGGAIILGKTKLSSFLSREEPSESIDFQAAWNPRADGYQTTGGSSSGSAAAVAAYDWTDIGIGTDTNGSIRRPAQCNGVFGLRPSQGIFPQDGMFTIFNHVDVPGIFARDIGKLAAFARMWYGEPFTERITESLPSRKKVVLDFLEDFGAFLHIKAERIKLSELWGQSPPKEAKGQSLHEYLKDVGRDTFLYANYHSGTGFPYTYREKFGKNPFVTKLVQWRWEVGSKISDEMHMEAMRRVSVYKNWFLNIVMRVGETDTFVVMQSEDVTPKYRDDPPLEYSIQPAWHQWWISPFLGAPEIVIPAGTIAYQSRISGNIEHLPVTAQILSQPGMLRMAYPNYQVLSGKGGVGKSSITTQLALSLSLSNKTVGILDIDLTGPSIPRLLGLEDAKITQTSLGWKPVLVHPSQNLPPLPAEHQPPSPSPSSSRPNNDQNGNSTHPPSHPFPATEEIRIGALHATSLAFLLPSRSSAVIWRGPKKTAMVRQFLTDVQWPPLDYLLIDTPPGTSDEHISLAETLLKTLPPPITSTTSTEINGRTVGEGGQD
ncbi:uncharacterized protein KY384_005232 [Bacidia gigantensis]|uniref:uncharacterized protein n=1 Tax=Bacidia gigantensis TaxID=2732470 RepID=UPI001D038627|nr:uncharacterized protein KY384_005232 [Bacidia gigantensis]KAG8529751.1 hypothetical protein KY384_005232 [Bacidia gigantensis]